MTLRPWVALLAALPAVAPAADPPGRPAGVDVVPPSAFAFVSVRASDVWDSAALKPGRDALLKAQPRMLEEFEKVAGFVPADVERVTMFWPAVPFDGPVPPLTVVTTRKPYNEAKVLKSLRARPVTPWGRPRAGHGHAAPAPATATVKEAVTTPDTAVESAPAPVDSAVPKECDGEPRAAADERPTDTPVAKAGDVRDEPDLFALPGGPFAAVYLLDDRTLLFLTDRGPLGESGLLTLVGQLLRPRADGPLAEALALTAKHTVVAAARVSQAEAALRGLPDPGAELVPFRSLLRARTVTATADVAELAKVNVRLAFADAAAARRAEPVLATLLQFAGEGLAAVRKDAEKDDRAAPVVLPLIDLTAQAVEKAVVKADGAAVTATLEADFGPAVAKAVAQAPQALHAASERTATMNHLRQIGIAIHSFHDAHNQMPADVMDAEGKPLLSWRVQLLPYLEQAGLHRQFDLTKPWDHPANRKLLEQMPAVFRVAGREPGERGLTYLQMPSLDAPAEGVVPVKVRGRKSRLFDMTDGTSNTLMVVEAADPVAWTKPADLPFDPKNLPKLGAPDRGRFLALFGDGSVREFRRNKLTDVVLRALLTANGGEAVGVPD